MELNEDDLIFRGLLGVAMDFARQRYKDREWITKEEFASCIEESWGVAMSIEAKKSFDEILKHITRIKL